MHRNHPQGRQDGSENIYSAHNNRIRRPVTDRSRGRRQIHLVQLFTAPLNPRRPTVGVPFARMAFRSDKSAEQRDDRPSRRTNRHRTRPETHQNLIHIAKTITAAATATAQTARPHRGHCAQAMIEPNSGHSAIQRV